MEKPFHIPFALCPVDKSGFQNLVGSLLAGIKEDGGQNGEGWQSLHEYLASVVGAGAWQRFTPGTLRKWALQVSRYSFALDSSQTLYDQFGPWDQPAE